MIGYRLCLSDPVIGVSHCRCLNSWYLKYLSLALRVMSITEDYVSSMSLIMRVFLSALLISLTYVKEYEKGVSGVP